MAINTRGIPERRWAKSLEIARSSFAPARPCEVHLLILSGLGLLQESPEGSAVGDQKLPPTNITQVDLVGKAEVGSVISARPGTWVGVPAPEVKTTLLVGGIARRSPYLLQPEDDGQAVVGCDVASNAAGTATMVSPGLQVRYAAPQALAVPVNLAIDASGAPLEIDVGSLFIGTVGGTWSASISDGDSQFPCTVDDRGRVTVATAGTLRVSYSNSGGTATISFPVQGVSGTGEVPVYDGSLGDIAVDAGGEVSVAAGAAFSGPSLVFSAAGLPKGISLDPQSGTIAGQSADTGRYSVSVTATNSVGSASGSFQLEVMDNRISPEAPAYDETFDLRDATVWELTGSVGGATTAHAAVDGYPQALTVTAGANWHRLNLAEPFTPPQAAEYEFVVLYQSGTTGQIRFTLKNLTDLSEESVKGAPGLLTSTPLLTVAHDAETSQPGVWRLGVRAMLDSAKTYEPGIGPNGVGDITLLDFDMSMMPMVETALAPQVGTFLAVSPTGNDGTGAAEWLADHSGDSRAAIAAARAVPFATPQAAAEAASKAASGASAAVAVLIEDGVYRAPDTTTPVLHIRPNSSGTASAPIIVTAINRRQVTFTGPANFSCVRADGGKHLELHGCVIVGNATSPDHAPIKCEDGSSDESTPLHLTFADNLLTGQGNDGVKCGTVSNVNFYGNEWAAGIVLNEEGLDFVSVTNSEVKWNSLTKRLMVKGGSKGNVIEGNRVISNREAALDGEPGLSRSNRQMWTGFPWSEACKNIWRSNVLETTATGRPPMWIRASDGSVFENNLLKAPAAVHGFQLSRAKSAYYQGKSYADVPAAAKPYTTESGASAGEYFGWCRNLSITGNFVVAGMTTGQVIDKDQNNNHTIGGTTVGTEADLGVVVGPAGWDTTRVLDRVGLPAPR